MEQDVVKLKRELTTLKAREALLGVDNYEAIARFRLVESSLVPLLYG